MLRPSSADSSSSQRTGLVLLILVVVQGILGVALKVLGQTRMQKDGRMPGVKGHPVQNIIHVSMGVSHLAVTVVKDRSDCAPV